MIHVCYGLRDESGKYSKFAGTSIQSLLDNTSKEVTIHILHDSTLSDENRRKLTIITYKHNQNIKFYNVEELASERIEFAKNQISNIGKFWGTIGALYRTMIPEFLDADRAIYLDTDVLVNLNIKDFWDIDLNGKSIAVVSEHESGASSERNACTFPLCKMKIVDPKNYFNSGVLLMDLSQLRKLGGGGHSLLESCIRILAEHPDFRFMDQDALNFIFKDDCVLLSAKFNRILQHIKKDKVEREIYHFCGVAHKPVPDFKIKLNRLWFSYFVKTPFFNSHSIENFYNAFESRFNDTRRRAMNRIDLLQKICKLSATHLRSFYTEPQNVDKIQNLLGENPNDLFFNASNPKALDVLIQDIKDFPDKRIYLFFIDDKRYRDLQAKLSELGAQCFNINSLFDSLPDLRNWKNLISKGI